MRRRAANTGQRDPDPVLSVVLVRRGNDAHLRLSVLLAEATGASRDKRAEVLSPRQPWTDRFRRLQDLLQDHPRKITLVDPDAAWPIRDPMNRFDDASCAAERAEFFSWLLAMGREQGWVFRRPSPCPEVSDHFEREGILSDPQGPDDFPVPALAPESRSLASWLVHTERVSEGFLRLVGLSKDPEATVFEAFHDGLGPRMRRTMNRVCLLREQHLLNGVAGPFSVSGDGDLSLDLEALGGLLDAGAVVVEAAGNQRFFHVPSGLRERVLRRVEAKCAEELVQDRARIVAVLSDATTPRERLEAHRQAVLTGDLDLVDKAASYYGNDLRIIARRISADAGRAKRGSAEARALYRDAAEVYRRILSRFDDSDAYAWQYLAFNSQRAGSNQRGGLELDGDEQTRIAEAYQSSCDLADRREFNPLFHARRLSFALLRGQEVQEEIHVKLLRTVDRFGMDHARFFVLPLKEAMRATGGWSDMVSRYPWVDELARRRGWPVHMDFET